VRKQLSYLGSVCRACSAKLDAEWENCNATDWVLVTSSVTENQRSVLAILWDLKVSIAEAKGQPKPVIPPDEKQATLHIFRDTNYTEMEVHWAAGGPRVGIVFGQATAVDQARVRSLLTNWPESENVAFIRPATEAEMAQHDQKLREDAKYKIIAGTFEKWGFDDEGQPLDRLEPREILQRRNNAYEEINRALRERGLS
jgi:hypothetical protein